MPEQSRRNTDQSDTANPFLQDLTIKINLNIFEIDMLLSQIKSSYLADLIKLKEKSFNQFVLLTGCLTPEDYLQKLEAAISDQKLDYDQPQLIVLTREQWLTASLILSAFHAYLESHSSKMDEIALSKAKDCVESLLSKIAGEIDKAEKHNSKKQDHKARVLH
ncbi:MAG: hypothetical protein PHC97_01705 [Patescibacteria group bacterium]|nr:hypothetical protein [Patescibacteria group bacterium]